MAAALTMASSPDLIVGILATEDADPYGPGSATPLNQLGFRGPGQMHGYYTDSVLGAHDKINVRQGRYMPFGPLHMVALTTGGNLTANAKLFIDLVLGNPTTPPAPFNVLDLTINTGLTPDCAMEVSRTAEGGPVALYTHPAPCGCYFDSKKAANGTTCATCTGTGQGTCTTTGQQCRNGFCESH
jgi:hypothetical protein